VKSWPECRRRIEHVFEAFLAQPLAALKAEELQLAADAHPSAQSAAAAVRYIRPVLKWAAQRRYVAADTAVLHPPATVGRRDRVLSRDEVAALLPMLARSVSPYARALRFMLWSLARREEVGRARWRDVSLDAATWTIPATKNGLPHFVPLPRQALAFLAGIKPADADPGALVLANSVGGPLANWDREAKAIMATSGTAAVLEKAGLQVQRVMKLLEGRPNVIDLLKNKEIQLVINTPSGAAPREDEVKIRTTAIYTGTPIMTTLSGARAAARGIAALKKSGYGVKTLQEYH